MVVSVVLLLSIGYRAGAAAPIFTDIPLGSRAVDPIVQAHKRFGRLDPNELTPLRG